jgi:hypothetical protein
VRKLVRPDGQRREGFFCIKDWGFGKLGDLRKEPDSASNQQKTLLSERNLAHGFLIACPQEAGQAVPWASKSSRHP